MFINKINSRLNYQTFKGYNHEINEVGRTVAKFYYPFDSKEQSAQIEFYRLRKNPKAYSGYEVENPSYQYLANTTMAYPYPKEIERMFADAGFENVKTHKLAFGLVAITTGVKK